MAMTPNSPGRQLRIAIINEKWTAGATRCARDLQRGLQRRHTVVYFPEGVVPSPRGYLERLADFRPDVVNLHSYFGARLSGITIDGVL